MNRKMIAGIGIVVVGIAIYFLTLTNTQTNANDVAPQPYAVNEQGQTYGEGPFPAGKDQEPDLIKAIGENGVEGYIKNADVTPSATSPEEALAQQKEIEELGYHSVPLYESDGITIIGEYRQYLIEPTP